MIPSEFLRSLLQEDGDIVGAYVKPLLPALADVVEAVQQFKEIDEVQRRKERRP